jgi:hypothetical protein
MVDPISSSFPHNSPYALQENKFGLGIELEGRELSEFFKGVNNAMREDIIPLQPSANRSFESNSYSAGKTTGHYASIVFGALEIAVGGTGDGAAALATVGSGGLGSPVTAPLAVGATALIGLGTNTVGNAIGNLNTEGSTRNPFGAKGKPAHQAKVNELTDKATKEAKEGEKVLSERKVQGHPSNRRPDSQIVNEAGKTRKIFEAERKPTSQRNIKREAEYKKLGIEYETHKVGQ